MSNERSVLPSREEVLSQLGRLAAEQMGAEPTCAQASSRLEDDLGMDSLDKIEFQMAIEEAYSVSLHDDNAESIATIGEAADALLSALAAR